MNDIQKAKKLLELHPEIEVFAQWDKEKKDFAKSHLEFGLSFGVDCKKLEGIRASFFEKFAESSYYEDSCYKIEVNDYNGEPLQFLLKNIDFYWATGEDEYHYHDNGVYEFDIECLNTNVKIIKVGDEVEDETSA